MDSLLERLNRVYRDVAPTHTKGKCPSGGEHEPANPESILQISGKDHNLDIWLCQNCQGLFYTKTERTE